MPIGRFARLSGLSLHTLRYYDEVALLQPDRTDLSSGYRYYSADQLTRARQLKALRAADLSIGEMRSILDRPESAADVLEQHHARLTRGRSLIDARLADVERFLTKGLPMPTITQVRPVQLKLLVADIDSAAAFYSDAFGFEYEVTQRTSDEDFSGFIFGRWDTSDFFLVHLQTSDSPGATGPATFGVLVPDLDAAHGRALAAGAVEVLAPHDTEGMPRSSAVRDPDANVVWLYQS